MPIRALRLLLLAGLAAGLAAPATAGPSAPGERLHGALEEVMRNADRLGFEGRRDLLSPVLVETYDLDWMAAKSLGRHWKKLGAEEQMRWRTLFRDLTAATYADRFDGFGGERFVVDGEEASSQGTRIVRTRIVRGEDGDPVSLHYRVREKQGGFRIIDVYLEGTVSELALRRGDYSSLVKREGFDALVAAVEKKIEEARAGTENSGAGAPASAQDDAASCSFSAPAFRPRSSSIWAARSMR